MFGVGNTGKDRPADGASASLGDAGESCHSRDEQPLGGLSRSSIKYTGIIKRTYRILSCLPDQVLLSILGAKVRPSLGAWESGNLGSSSFSLSSSSSSSSGAMLESWLPFELRSDGIVFILSIKCFSSFLF